MRYWQLPGAEATATCSLLHSENERQRSVNYFCADVCGIRGTARIFEHITELFTDLIGTMMIYQKNFTTVGHRRGRQHGCQSSCSLDKQRHNRLASHGHQCSLPKRGHRKAGQLDEGQANGRRPFTMDGELSVGRNVEMIIEGNSMERHPVEAEVEQG